MLLLLIFSSVLHSQNTSKEQLVYFDDEFNVSAKEYAAFVGIAIPKDDEVDVILYHLNGKQALTGTYADKTLQKRNGVFTWFDTTGGRIAVAAFKNNIQDGIYLFWYSNKVLRDSGEFKNGSPDGLWKSWYPNGQLRMVCAYNAKALADYRKSYAQNNMGVELMQLAKPQKIGNISRVDPQQDLSPRSRRGYYASLQEKDKQFNAVFNSDGGNERPITSSENDQQVFFSHILMRYDLIKPTAVLIDGNYFSYYPNGQLKESGNYKEGHKNGFWQSWYENGKRQSVGRYEKNHEIQEWKYYNEKGELETLRRFRKDGRLLNEIKM